MMPGAVQALQNAPAAIATGLSTSTPGGPDETPRYGLTMWFKVVVESLNSKGDLGLWSGCTGLGVNFGAESLKMGGSYDEPLSLPGAVTYPNVSLERAMRTADSRKVRTWLEQVAGTWINGAEGGARYAGTTVTITLYSSLKHSDGHKVAEWELHGAVPVSWSGPALSSKGGDVAIEKLVLSHAGFLRPNPQPARQGTLRLSFRNGPPLVFPYNPENVTLNKTVQFRGGPALVATTIEQQLTDPGKLSISLSKLTIEGATDVREKIAKLWDWLEPLAPMIGTHRSSPPKPNGWVGAQPAERRTPPPRTPPPAPSTAARGRAGDKRVNNTARPKILRLTMGAGAGGIERDCVLKAVNVTYTRFTAAFIPSRALVTLTLEDVPLPVKKQNPTSGGPPGGRVHTVTEGDSLQRIATEAYGSPSAWREIAERNGIDDPLRVRNGQTVLLAGTVRG